MRFYEIRIDEEVMEYLKSHAVPFQDTPNDVIRKLLGINKKTGEKNKLPASLEGIFTKLPAALQEILEVYILVRNGVNRIEATKLVAKQRNITYQSVIDKYTRQLDKNVYEIDQLMQPEKAAEFRSLLENKFPLFIDEIGIIFDKSEL